MRLRQRKIFNEMYQNCAVSTKYTIIYYMVDTYVKPDVLERIDPQQFGAVLKSSTTHALISMLHSWLESTDGNGATTRAVLFDFRKAFDLIDHHVLAQSSPRMTFQNRSCAGFWIS